MPAGISRLASAFVSTFVLLAAASSAGAQQNRTLEDGELEPLAASLSAYFEARTADSGVEESAAAVAQSLKALAGGKLADDPLLRVADLGRAFWLSRGYATKQVHKGKVTTEVLKRGSFTGAGLEYAYRVPKDYEPKKSVYPLILAVPDAGEPPAQHIRSHWILGDLLDHAILLCPAMPADPADWEHVMVKGRPGGLSHVLTALSLATETFALDFERVFVVGRGRGVAAAVATGNYSPQRFAGIAGRAGDAGELAPDNFTNLPSYFAAGKEQATAFRDALLAAGSDGCRVEAADDEGALWRWMQDHPRRTYPESVTLVPGKPFPTRAYWLRVAPSAPEARATVALDRAINAVRVSTTGVSQVTLYLNDALLDLNRPVRVFLNGLDVSALVPRRLATVLDLLHDETSDAASVYVAEAIFDTATGAGTMEAAAAADPEFDEQAKAAGERVEGLWELHEWCVATGRAAQSERALRRLLRVQPDHADARAALGYHGSAGLWFPSQEAFERYRRGQEEAVAKAKGLVLERGTWMHRDERALAVKGWVKDQPTGQWLAQGDVRKLAEGWTRQDLAWIAPPDVARVEDGLWLVDGEWLDLATANRRHAKIEALWHIPRREVLLHSTADRAVCLRAVEHMGRALEDLRKAFGAEPVLPLNVAMLRDEEQYDRFAFGDPDGRRRATDASRLHLVRSAYFAESWFQRVGGKLEFEGMGVCYWDPLEPNGDLYGVHAARLAVGLSYVEALDPSPKAVKKALSGGPQEGFYAAYQAEKLLPAWLRHGGAVYAERYFFDPTTAEGSDPWWARHWSLENLTGRGGLRNLQEVLAFRIDPDDRDDGLKLFLEAGLLVAFIVDGQCAPVTAAHEEFKRALAEGRLQKSHVTALTEALVANEAALRKF